MKNLKQLINPLNFRIMKPLCIFILCFVTALTSCSSDDDNNSEEGGGEMSNSDLIVGKWNVVAINLLPNTDCELLSTLEIKEDKTYLEQTYGGFVGACEPDAADAGTWELSDNILTLTLDELGNATSLTTEYTILELTETSLKYEFEDSDDNGSTFKEVWTFVKNDANTQTYSDTDVIGKWGLESLNVNGESVTLTQCEKNDTVSFYTTKDEINIANYIENTTQNNTCIPSTSNDYIWSISEGNVLIADFNNGSDTNISLIKELTDTSMTLETTETYTENGETKTDIVIGKYKFLGEPDMPDTSNSDVLGKWGLISFTQQGDIMTITECEKRSTIEFESQSFTDISYAPVNTGCQIDYQETGTWKEEGTTLTFTYQEEGQTFIDVATFSIVSDVLTIKYDDEGFMTESAYKKL